MNKVYTFVLIKDIIQSEIKIEADTLVKAKKKLYRSGKSFDKYYVLSYTRSDGTIKYSPFKKIYKK